MMSNERLRWVVVVGIVALYMGLDPLNISPAAQVQEFTPQYLSLPSYANITFPRDTHNRLQKAEIQETDFCGPESLAFDAQGRGPYTGTSDGRVMRWDGPLVGWTEFAYIALNRSHVCKASSVPSPDSEHICGRPLGLRFNHKTGDLYITDAYFGLLMVGPEGGLAKLLTNEAEHISFRFTNDLDIDSGGIIYFTDSSTKFERRNFMLAILAADNSGRLLKYDFKTKETSVLLRDLHFPNGISLSKDGSFLVLAETTTARLLRFWLKGPKAGKAELFAQLPGHPDNVRCNDKGEFWVAIHSVRSELLRFLGPLPLLRKALLKIPVPLRYTYSKFQKSQGMVVRYNADGEILEVLEDQQGAVVKYISEVEEQNGKLWLGSVLLPRIAILERLA
ncbi:hypothetical protein O6H91_Y008600 [Diphasiastrum complanatum]|nr:hypothetical protein O6H91_Y008600 [Diphasiastrum complanatum]